MNTKQLIKELAAAKKTISKTRDRLREIVSEYEDLSEVCDRACCDIDSAIDTLSELV